MSAERVFLTHMKIHTCRHTLTNEYTYRYTHIQVQLCQSPIQAPVLENAHVGIQYMQEYTCKHIYMSVPACMPLYKYVPIRILLYKCIPSLLWLYVYSFIYTHLVWAYVHEQGMTMK